ncbi:beta/alpha barrel domain-containing protein [Flammeovirga aprica]|uniref:Hydroxymethylglutaryl-CoA lyase n=1 Tax=Flammeovirga aprica JL-4 TaxID=694437 RepID=A0A7X9NZS3_9BACT|nr:hydroxymethylglutaryl-CoA lyase [Flammeovirga aprica]NME66936.1 hydroxymethylglutaryl-CoA lyase [Flammeovirga aprica JL-4]
MVKIIECPRDAMQGLSNFIPTATKIEYLNLLLQVGFDTLDFGSFVSPKAIPQMKDTKEVLAELEKTDTKLLSIVVNERGASDALHYPEINFLGFPLSVSETFQQRNTKKSIAEAKVELHKINTLAQGNHKETVAYLSMAFGNPYEEEFSTSKVLEMAHELSEMGIGIISLSDTIGTANAKDIQDLFENASKLLPNTELGVHLHCNPFKATELASAAINAGCRRIDTALGGLGGCPMAKDSLTGNLATESLIEALQDQPSLMPALNLGILEKASEFRQHNIG